MWHYVAQCGTIFMYCFFKKTKKNDGFPGFLKKSKYCQFGCGTMWHYVALCGTIFMYCFSKEIVKMMIFKEIEKI